MSLGLQHNELHLYFGKLNKWTNLSDAETVCSKYYDVAMFSRARVAQ
jgi:hypothetical protein